jgi:3-oxoacyl-[acyl-carrier protein] reductase
MDFGLKGCHALVTGGSRGIGRAIVLALAEQGATVTACYANPGPAVDSLAAAVDGAGVRLVRADVRNPEDVTRLAEECGGPLHVVVNNAAVVSHHPVAELDEDEWHRVLDTNLTGMYRVVRAVLPYLADPASIVNVSSAVAARGESTLTHYTAAKSGVLGLTRSLAKELGHRGVRVNAIAPGLVDTDQMAGMSAESKQRFEARIPLGRVARPDEMTGAVLFLASDASSYVTGATLHVDGGI